MGRDIFFVFVIEADAQIVLKISDDAIKDASRRFCEENALIALLKIRKTIVFYDSIRLFLISRLIGKQNKREGFAAIFNVSKNLVEIPLQKLLAVKQAGF